MEYSSLYDLIRFFSRGTKLHIGVIPLGNFGGEAFYLPFDQTIHASKACQRFKESDGGFRRCYRCRQMAIEKALLTQTDFGGYCINGVYEYTRPVVIDDEVAAIIYIGNILKRGGNSAALARLLKENTELLETLETDFDEEDCCALGRLIESYIRALWEQEARLSLDRKPSLIENVKTYVAANLEYDISLSDMARIFHYNTQYFGRLFKRETGESFAEYINRERVTRAAEYLKGDLNVTSIAYRVGFNNITYFNRSFKRCFKVSPLEYKRNLSK